MSYGRTITEAPGQGVITKACKFDDNLLKERRNPDGIPVFPVGPDEYYGVKRGEPMLALKDERLTDERASVFTALNGLAVTQYEIDDYRGPEVDEDEIVRAILYRKIRCVGLSQKDVEWTNTAGFVDGPVAQKAGERTFTWRQRSPAFEGQWVVWRLPDEINLQGRAGYGDTMGRVVAELAPIDEQDFFPHAQMMIEMLGLEKNTESFSNVPLGRSEDGYGLANSFQKFCQLIALKALVAKGVDANEALAFVGLHGAPIRLGDQLGTKYRGFHSMKAIMHSALKPAPHDGSYKMVTHSHGRTVKDVEVNGAMQFFVDTKLHACDTLDRIVGRVSKGCSGPNATVDVIVSSRPIP